MLEIDIQGKESDEVSHLELPYADAFELMNGKDDYESLVDLLNLENGQFVINTTA
jgi:hypothetical protein